MGWGVAVKKWEVTTESGRKRVSLRFFRIGVLFVVCMQMVKREAGIRADGRERKENEGRKRKRKKDVPARSRNKKRGEHPTEG